MITHLLLVLLQKLGTLQLERGSQQILFNAEWSANPWSNLRAENMGNSQLNLA